MHNTRLIASPVDIVKVNTGAFKEAGNPFFYSPIPLKF